MYDGQQRFCPRCARVCAVLIPPCADGHGVDCPERCCAECGTAFLLDPLLLDPLLREPAPVVAVAPKQHAA